MGSLVRRTEKGQPYVYVTTPVEMVKQILGYAKRYRAGTHDAVAVDCETNGDDPYAATVFTLQLAVNDRVGLLPLVVDLRTALSQESLLVLNGYLTQPGLTKIFQGGKFELKMLSRLRIMLRAPYFDTMLVSQILMSGQQEGSKLGDLSQRYLGVTLDKSLQTSFLDLPPDAVLGDEQIGYAVEDVLVLLKLKPVMEDALAQYKSSTRTWGREQSFLPLLASLEVGGVRFRAEGLVGLYERLGRQLKSYKIYAEGSLLGTPAVWGGYDPVNLDNAESVKSALLAQDIPYSSTQNADLLKQGDEPAVMHLLHYRHCKRRYEQVEALCENSKLHKHGNRQFHLLPHYSQIEYLTGRLSHSHTGLEALMPWDEESQERFIGSLLMARSEGNSLIGVKLKEAPLRVLAQVTQDEVLLNLYRSEGSAVTKLADSLNVDSALSWALWMGAGVYGYRKPAKWQEFVYESTGSVLALGRAKDLLAAFWQIMSGLKQWHQDHSAPKDSAFTLSGRYRYSHRSSHADRMAHLVLGSLSDLVKEAAVEIHQGLAPLGGKPYLILGDYLIWEVPTQSQTELLNLASEVLMERCRKYLPNVVKAYEAEVLAAVPVRDVLL